MDTDGLSLLDGSSLGQRLALYFADSRQGYFNPLLSSRYTASFGTHTYYAGHKVA